MPSRLFRVVLTMVLFAVAWLLWSGMYKPLLLTLGLLSVLATTMLAWQMRYFKKRAFALRFSFGIVRYWGWLFIEVVKSSIQVLREVLKPTIEVKPVLLCIPRDQRSEFQTMMLGNSITLTPGTITLDVDEDRILVHALTEAGAVDLQGGEMERRVDAFAEEK